MAAWVSLPESLEEFSTRSGVKDSVPEGTQFGEDQLGNYCAQFTQDGSDCYYVLLQGEESYGSLVISAPEGELDAQAAALWASGSILD